MPNVEKTAQDAAARLIDQGVLGSLLVLAVIAIVLLIVLLLRSWKSCNDQGQNEAKKISDLQERWREETKEIQREFSRVLSESASSNVERARTMTAMSDALQKVATGLEMLLASQKAAGERWGDRVSNLENRIDDGISKVETGIAKVEELRTELTRHGLGGSRVG